MHGRCAIGPGFNLSKCRGGMEGLSSGTVSLSDLIGSHLSPTCPQTCASGNQRALSASCQSPGNHEA